MVNQLPLKPIYIIAAVMVISVIMALTLPKLSTASPAPVAAAAPAVLEEAAPAPLQVTALGHPAPTRTPAPAASPTSAPAAQTGSGIAVPAGQPAPADAPTVQVPEHVDTSTLDAFAASVVNGRAGELVGIYVEGRFALPVIQQPTNDPNFVANVDQSLTAYARSASYGTLGLLAHNTLSGAAFFHLETGQAVVAIFGDGRQERYRITGTQAYQALSPNEPTSNFIDLSDATQTVIGHQVVFDRVYAQRGRLVFQTCIEANGISTWGRLFVIAEQS